MTKKKIKADRRYRRHERVRAKVFGTAERPRLCVFRSAKHIYAQLMDDEKGHTLVAASDLELKTKRKKERKKRKKFPPSKAPAPAEASVGKSRKIAIAYEVGNLIAEKALKKNIKKAIFDRGGYKYHGRVKALAEGARERGLRF